MKEPVPTVSLSELINAGSDPDDDATAGDDREVESVVTERPEPE